MSRLFWLAAIAGCVPAATIPGEFVLRPAGEGVVSIELDRRDTMVDGRRRIVLPAETLKGYDAAAADASFRFETPAGNFEFFGRSTEGLVAGRFAFVPDDGFSSSLKGKIWNWWEPRHAFEAAVREHLDSQRFWDPTLLDSPSSPWVRSRLPESMSPAVLNSLRQSRGLGVSADVLHELHRSGYNSMSNSSLMRLRTNRIDSFDLMRFRLQGYRDLTPDQMYKLKYTSPPGRLGPGTGVRRR